MEPHRGIGGLIKGRLFLYRCGPKEGAAVRLIHHGGPKQDRLLIYCCGPNRGAAVLLVVVGMPTSGIPPINSFAVEAADRRHTLKEGIGGRRRRLRRLHP